MEKQEEEEGATTSSWRECRVGMVVIRGLHNPATACHVTSPLLLLAYALRPLAHGIQAASTTCPQDALLRAWAAVLQELLVEEEDASEAVHPQNLYTQIQKASGGIRIHELGDANTSLVKLLSLLGRRPPEDEGDTSLLPDLVEKALSSGRCSSVLTGILYDRKEGTCRKRTKRTPEKALPTLFRVSPTGDDDEDLVQALDTALLAQVVQGYQWSGFYDEVTLPWEGTPPVVQATDDDGWYTTKELQMQSLPPFWLIHVDHFVSINGKVRPRYQTCRIPLTLHTARFLAVVGSEQKEDTLYRLNGAILHVSNRVDRAQDDEEDGHYVVLIRSSRSEDSWTLVDDDCTTDISQETCLSLLAGCDSSRSNHGTYIQACLLLYESNDANQTVDPIVQRLVSQAEVIKHEGQALVGRRLRVLWGKGKYYAGVVTGFDAALGKHTVQYTDGDIRTYRLSKKTVQWLDDVEASACP